jgi:beta-phosphoglucomutase-like phosphatase (HAD superfamily)
LHHYFTDIVSGEDFPKSKPDPAIFVYAASLSIASKANCMIEDSTTVLELLKLLDLLRRVQ